MSLASRVIAPAFATLFSCLFFSLSATEAVGGGAPYTVKCPAGLVVSGLEGRTGAWIDDFQVLCNNMSGVERKAVPSVGYSPGGSFTRAVCPALSGVISMEFDYVDSGGGVQVVNKIKLTCGDFIDSAEEPYRPVYGQNDEGSSRYDYTVSCSGRNFVNQLNGRAWTYIDSIDNVGCLNIRDLGNN